MCKLVYDVRETLLRIKNDAVEYDGLHYSFT